MDSRRPDVGNAVTNLSKFLSFLSKILKDLPLVELCDNLEKIPVNVDINGGTLPGFVDAADGND